MKHESMGTAVLSLSDERHGYSRTRLIRMLPTGVLISISSVMCCCTKEAGGQGAPMLLCVHSMLHLVQTWPTQSRTLAKGKPGTRRAFLHPTTAHVQKQQAPDHHGPSLRHKLVA